MASNNSNRWLARVSKQKASATQINLEYDNPTATGLSSLPITIDADLTVRKFKELVASRVGVALQEMILSDPQKQGGAAGVRVELTIKDDDFMLRQIKDMNLNTIRVERKKPAEGDVNTEAHRVNITHNKSSGRGVQFNICMTPDNSSRAVDAKIDYNETLEEGDQFNVNGPASRVVEWAKSRSATDDARRK